MLYPRFFAPDIRSDDPRLTLSATESQHLARVLRLGAGDRVRVFDGRGGEYDAAIEVVSHRATVLRLEGTVSPLSEALVPVTLAQALLKGDSMDAVIRDATMLGVTRIVPMITNRTNVAMRRVTTGKARGRWQRVALASAKQCGRAYVPLIEPTESLDVVLKSEAGLRLVLAEPALHAPRTRLPQPDARGAVLIVGPEGGWAPDEIELAHIHGWVSWSIVPWILRAEAVALTALSVLQYEWNRRP
ncbi:MAG: 16S rRNA (uracil(1498)-N(3))-methyltransferase [Luteitalea sp.]|nr:16S rRNA (uracil(1498)-N(3))-methyltransferase [Luteitalea sp.]